MTKARRKKSLPAIDLFQSDDAMDALTKLPSLYSVILSVAYLEQCLRTLLAIRLKKSETTESLLSPDGLLGTFKAKSDLAYVTEIISKETYQQLLVVAEIRNIFAHSHEHVSFESTEIKILIEGDGSSAGLSRAAASQVHANDFGTGESRSIHFSSQAKNTREKFEMAIFLLHWILSNLILEASKAKVDKSRHQKRPSRDSTQSTAGRSK